MRARKKPIIIECHPADDSLKKLKPGDVPKWLHDAFIKKDVWLEGDLVCVSTHSGLAKDHLGCCWIMKDKKGLYICDNEVFAESYEVLDEQPVKKA